MIIKAQIASRVMMETIRCRLHSFGASETFFRIVNAPITIWLNNAPNLFFFFLVRTRFVYFAISPQHAPDREPPWGLILYEATNRKLHISITSLGADDDESDFDHEDG